MAVISEYEEEKSQNFSTTGANAEELVGPYDEVLGKILQEQSPLALMEILIDFLRRKSDLFRDDSVENRIADMVSSAKRKDAEEKKGKACVQQKAEKRLKQDEPSASTAATYSASREAVKAPKTSDDEDSGLKPNLVTYNTMLDAIGKAGRPSMAKVLNKEMIDEGLTPPSQTVEDALVQLLLHGRVP